MNKPNTAVRLVAQHYNHLHHLPPIVEAHCVQVNLERAYRIAQTFEALPLFDESAREAYTQLGIEIQAQWAFICSIGYDLKPWDRDGQPYANSEEMCADILNNHRLFFFLGGDVHPFLGEKDASGLSLNDKFRAVHDFFGHASEGYTFGPRGEENAWIHHSMMFSPLAQRALTTETRGQNSWFNYGPYSHLPVQERPFAVQKCALLPDEYTDWIAALNG